MAVGVVIGLEMVDIGNDEGEEGLTAAAPLPFPDQGFIEESAVGQIGEAVQGRELPQFFIGFFKFMFQGFEFRNFGIEFPGFDFKKLSLIVEFEENFHLGC